MKSLMEKLTRARTILILDHAFFGCLALSLKLILDESTPTACTNGKRVRWSPVFLAALNKAEVIGVMAHEILHCALGHIWRRGTRNMKKWNRACDYIVNDLLLKSNFTLPKGALISDSVNNYHGKSAEEIYDLLPDQNDDDQDDGMGNFEESDNPDDAPLDKAKWKQAVSKAVKISKGTISNDLARQIQNDVLDSSVPWYILLRDFLDRTAKNDYNWTRPNRRHLQRGIVLPTLISDELPEIVIAIDTSCSIGQKELNHFAKEASAVLGCFETTIRLLYCDTKINGKEEVYTRADLPLKLEPRGGGGTSFVPVFDYIEEHKYTPACLIYFTDLYGRFPDKAPDYPTMWLVPERYKNNKHKFGHKVTFKMNN